MEEIVFERYTEISAKDHERQRRAGVGSNTFNLDLNSPLPSREAVIRKQTQQAWPVTSSQHVQPGVWGVS